jgi:hypothetical protein
MIAFNALVVVGAWTPVDGNEYPTITMEPGYSWRIEGVDDTLGYEYQTGDLTGKIAYNGDWIIYGQSGWILTPIKIEVEDYYRVDGTNPLIADFNGGGHKISHITDGVNDTDAVILRQLTTGLATKADTYHTHSASDITPQGAGSLLDADFLDGYDSTDFMMANANINPGQIQPQGDASGLDADMLDGKHASEFFNTIDGVDWSALVNVPTEFPPNKANQTTIGGIRIWAEGDILNIATDDYVAP